MGKSLVIVESPAKARTIERYLGRDFEVEATMGHIRDLPKKDLGINIEKGFKPTYKVLAGRSKIVKGLKAKADEAERVYLAPDLDREGEAIAWHVKEALKIPEEKAFRVTFNEITKAAIQKAFAKPGKLLLDKVNAQQARRILDRLVGYQISPLLWRRIPNVGSKGRGGGLSAGRVQSVAVRLIVEREREIEAFDAKEYWRIIAELGGGGGEFKAELELKGGEKLEIGNEEAAKGVLAELADAKWAVSSVESKETRSKAPAPFTTSTLQQAASTQLKFPAKKTMRTAQGLYEGVDVGEEGPVALITYMRTDSVRVSGEAIAATRGHIEEAFGSKYLPGKAVQYRSKGKAQEAHEAVRPTYVERTPESLRGKLTGDYWKLYDLIWRRAVASQMRPAVFNVTTANIGAGDYTFVAKGRTVVFPGHTVLARGDKGEEDMLPALSEGMELELKGLEPSQRFTQPPARYTEASLVRTLEREGIGRPSTYAAIISTIQDRRYVEQMKRLFHPTALGVFVTDKLVKHFPKVLNVKFTSHMEEELDRIETGQMDWVRVLEEFYEPFKESLEAAADEMKPFEETDEKCPDCGKELVKRLSRAGMFLACTGYPDCKYTRNLSATGSAVDADIEEKKCPECGKALVVRGGSRGAFVGCTGYPECKYTSSVEDPEGGAGDKSSGEESKMEEQREERKCPDCGKAMAVRRGPRGEFWGCTGFPKCRHTEALEGEAKEEEGEKQVIDKKCPNCGKTLVVKKGRRGPFLACPGYPDCKHAEPLSGEARKKAPAEKVGRECPECGKDLLWRKGPRGKFVGCSGFPKCRFTEQVGKGE